MARLHISRRWSSGVPSANLRKPRVNKWRNAPEAQICSELGTAEKVASGMEYRGVKFSVVLGSAASSGDGMRLF